MKNETLNEKFERAVKEYGMLDTPSVLVGLSGGADSSVLLSLLFDVCTKRGISLFAAHVNHNIRGDEALRDRNFCSDMCARMGIRLFILDADVPALAKESGKSLEECARDVRYSYFASLMREHGIKTLATAHNADDNLETVIFNMLRGAGTKGLSGIPPTRPAEGGRLVRPLIYAAKSEITDFAKAKGIEFVTDSTNTDTDYTRNHIRALIVPELRSLCHSPEEAVSRLSASLRADDEFIEKCADELTAKEKIEHTASVSLLSSLDTALFFRVITRMCPTSLAHTHVCAIKELVTKGKEGSRLSLPGRTAALIRKNALSFVPDNTLEEAGVEFRYELFEGCNPIPECSVTVNITRTSQTCENIYKNFIHTSIPFDKIEGNLYVRNRADGDRYTYGGMTRKLKKLLCDKKIPQEERDRIPIICDDTGILWVPGFPPREKPSKNDNENLNIYIEKTEK